MPRFSAKESAAAARAAHAYLSGASTPPTTRANPSPGKYSINDTAALHHANAALTKKYIYLLKAGKPLPSDSKGGSPSALTGPEERALVTFIRSVERSAFAVSEASIRNYASFLRGHRFDNPQPPVSVSWVRRFKKRHPELQYKSPKVQEVTRAAAETDVQHIDNWFKEFDALMSTLGIQKCDLWNFDETPLQIGWVNGSLKLFSTRMKRNTRPTVFQPGNKESLTSFDAISAAGRAIPSFLILTAKTLLEEYTRADIDERLSSGCNTLTAVRRGRRFNDSHLASIYERTESKGVKWLSCMIQATGEIQSKRCWSCNKNQGAFDDCIIVGGDLFQKCGNCEWNRQRCHGASGDTIDILASRKRSRQQREAKGSHTRPEPEPEPPRLEIQPRPEPAPEPQPEQAPRTEEPVCVSSHHPSPQPVHQPVPPPAPERGPERAPEPAYRRAYEPSPAPVSRPAPVPRPDLAPERMVEAMVAPSQSQSQPRPEVPCSAVPSHAPRPTRPSILQPTTEFDTPMEGTSAPMPIELSPQPTESPSEEPLEEITRDNLVLRHNGEVYTYPECVEGVPLVKINENHPYWEPNWPNVRTLIEPQLARWREKHQAAIDAGPKQEKGGSSKYQIGQLVNRGVKILEFHEQGPVSPYQLLSKKYIQSGKGGITSYDALFRLSETMSELEKFKLDIQPIEWMRQRLHELILAEGASFNLPRTIHDFYHDPKLTALRPSAKPCLPGMAAGRWRLKPKLKGL
ncbi:hypothetical protein MRS44_018435 [Fusarium solani]|uniref:uncharacterized protein n=1 Tax=Fusarium solani TaxID=169388 RepID=UPI0032C3F626|nr:hypothetical protein MRS44_018435 [Fusarium solani]